MILFRLWFGWARCGAVNNSWEAKLTAGVLCYGCCDVSPGPCIQNSLPLLPKVWGPNGRKQNQAIEAATGQWDERCVEFITWPSGYHGSALSPSQIKLLTNFEMLYVCANTTQSNVSSERFKYTSATFPKTGINNRCSSLEHCTTSKHFIIVRL